jgi:hypothetical protein
MFAAKTINTTMKVRTPSTKAPRWGESTRRYGPVTRCLYIFGMHATDANAPHIDPRTFINHIEKKIVSVNKSHSFLKKHKENEHKVSSIFIKYEHLQQKLRGEMNQHEDMVQLSDASECTNSCHCRSMNLHKSHEDDDVEQK